MYALVDCNSFYASCERVFRPDLVVRPVAVLSNNDGCVIAATSEVKALGVRIGTPYFKCRRMLAAAGTEVFSANFELYGDMSARVEECLRHHATRVETYSIDESFIDCSGFCAAHLDTFLVSLRDAVLRWTAIPVCIGAAATKTLAKAANRFAKKSLSGNGICVIASEHERKTVLCATPVGGVWGIGGALRARLEAHGVHSALDLSRANEEWARSAMGVAGLRTVRELRGDSCIGLQEAEPPRKTLVHTRTFGERITEYADMAEAVGEFARRSAEKLRGHARLAGALRVFITAGEHIPGARCTAGAVAEFAHPTSDTMEIREAAGRLLRGIWKPGPRYIKAGVMLLGLRPAAQEQGLLRLGDEPHDRRALMRAIDALNARYGAGTLLIGAENRRTRATAPKWQMNQKRRSPRYTTRVEDICAVH